MRSRIHIAAPELLAMVKILVDQLENAMNTPDEKGYTVASDSVYRMRLDRIKSAISKAEGRE